MHQNSSACAGVRTCDCTHQIKKTLIELQSERNALICFYEKVQINNAKTENFSFYSPLPACPYFSNCDQYKPNKIVMAAINSSHKLQGFCI